MSALPQEPDGVRSDIQETDMTDRELMLSIYAKLSKAETFIDELMPTLRLMSEELKRGGIMGLMGVMMRPPKG